MQTTKKALTVNNIFNIMLRVFVSVALHAREKEKPVTNELVVDAERISEDKPGHSLIAAFSQLQI